MSDTLAELERWLQSQILSDRSADDDQLAEHLLPSAQCTVRQRLDIYRHAYRARLVECLEGLFPAVAQLVGDEAFAQLAKGYLAVYPSRSYTLARLGDSFPSFVRQSADASALVDVVAELAELELLFNQVFDGPGPESLPPWDMQELVTMTPEARSSLVFVPSPCLQLRTFAYPVDALYTALRHDGPLPELTPSPTHLAITRRDYVVRRRRLEPAPFRLFSLLAEHLPLGEAFALLVREEVASPAQLDDSVAEWFAGAVRETLFVDARPMGPTPVDTPNHHNGARPN